jgi:hypothetical protein
VEASSKQVETMQEQLKAAQDAAERASAMSIEADKEGKRIQGQARRG